MIFLNLSKRNISRFLSYLTHCLQSEEDDKSDHQAKQTHSLGQGKAENGVREQLLLQRGVPGVTDDQRAEHCSDTSSRASHADGSGTSADELGGLVDVGPDGGGGDRPGEGHPEGGRGPGDERSGEHLCWVWWRPGSVSVS